MNPSGTGLLASLSDVSVRYGEAADEHALVDVSLDIGHGERVALLGSSGAGKSTVLDVLGGRRRPTTGAALVDGVDLARASGHIARRTRARIGMVAQRSELVPSLSVHRNVLLGRAGAQRSLTTLWSLARLADGEGVCQALDAVGLGDMANRSTSTLSGGQRQRASIARVRYQSPDLVLADEPVSNLDPTRSVAMLELLTGLVDERPACSLVVALHDPDLARRHCDRIIGIASGAVVFDRPTAEVSDDMIDALYASLPADALDMPNHA